MAYRRYRAILILTNRLNAEQRTRLDRSAAALPTLSRTKLQPKYEQVRSELVALEREVGAIGSLQEYEQLIDDAKNAPKPLLFMPKFVIEQNLFTRYEKAWPPYAFLPLHARISIDTAGKRTKPQVESWLLEAKLFEDMALLWNAYRDSSENRSENVKWNEALARATARSAFYLIEGFLKGIAEDLLLGPDRKRLSDGEIDKLQEWDSKREQSRYLKMRDKVLQYPKIALSLEHPPLTEQNSQPFSFLVDEERRIRHPLIHPSPGHDPAGGTHREEAFFDLDVEEVEKIVDSTVELLGEISRLLRTDERLLNSWLFHRGTDGRFGPETFE